MSFKTDAKGKGILLQVAFKGAIDASPDPDPNAIHSLTQRYFKVLLALGEEFEVEFTAAKSGGGGYRGGSGGGNAPSTRASLDKVSIDYFGDGKPIEFYDQRPAKAAGKYSAKAPDFNSVDKFDIRGDGDAKNIPIWLVSQDGTYNEQAARLLADAGVNLSAPSSPVEVAAPPAANDPTRVF